MSVISAQNLGLSFGAFCLFRGISVTIANDAKIGLIGPNGIGKTSLMMILAGLNQPTTGSIHIARGKRLGYLRQEASDTLSKTSGTGDFGQTSGTRDSAETAYPLAFARDKNTVYGEMLSVFSGLQDQQMYLHKLEADMAGGCYTGEKITAYGDIQTA